MSLRQLLPLALSMMLTGLNTGVQAATAPTGVAQAGTAQASRLSAFETNFDQAMEAYLSKSTGRSPIGFALSVTPKANSVYELGLPSAIQRDTLLKLTLDLRGAQPKVYGRVYSQAEKDLLLAAVTKAFGAPEAPMIETFPYQSVGKDYAITRNQADLYVKPQAVAGDNLATQARLGTPLRLLEYSPDGKFALVRVEDDGYIAWIQRQDLVEGEQAWFSDWLAHRQVLVMHAIDAPMKLYVGTRLKLVRDAGASLVAALPDGKQVTLNKNDVVLNTPGKLPAAETVLKTAYTYLPKAPQGGGAYLWGGTYGTTLDCSGFVQTVYRLNGVYLPRDADQQKGFTQRVGNTLAQLGELRPGDLVFFSGNKKYPTHVGMYIGNNQVIHSSPKGPYSGVKISTLVGGGEYDKFLQSIYFGGGRVTRSL